MLRIQNVLLNRGLNCGFDHDFLPGKMTVVLGRNQAGKTNLCRLIAGLSTQASGDLSLHGQSMNNLNPQKRSVAVVFQAFVNYPNWSVAQNIASPMVAANADKAYIQYRVAELAGTLGLGDLLERMPNELSGGQQQRLAIARALAKEAQVLLLDEPLVNLDYKLREALALELRSLLEASDTTVVYTTTDPKDAFTLGDDLLLLDQGKKLQSGAPLAVYQKPTGLAGANLMSDPGINTFPWTALEGKGFSQQGAVNDSLANEEKRDLGGVRPEHLFFADRAGEDAVSFKLQVSALETSGDETFVHGMVGQELWVVRCPGMLNVQPGQELTVAAAKRDILSFGGV